MGTEGKRLTPGQGWVLMLTSVASFMVSLDTQVVATALPVIRVHLHASLAALEWTVNAYTLTFAVLLLPGAALGERLGRRRMLAVGMGLFTAASAACAVAPSAGALIAARAVQGAGGALVLPLAFALLSAGFPPQRRAWAIGIFTAVTGLAVAAGPVVGGAVAQGIAWPWIFWLNVPLGIVLVPLIVTKLSGTTRAPARLDPLGLVLATGAALGVVWALIRVTSLGWGSPQVVVTLAAGAALTGVFIGWEQRAAHPMVPLGLFRIRAYAAGNAACLCIFAVLFGLVFFMAQFLQTGLGYGPLGAGLRLLPGWGALVVIAPFAGPLIRRLGERVLITGGLAVFAGALIWIALIARAGLPYADMVLPLILAGSGVSVAIPPTQSVVMTAVEPADIGKASGTFNMLRQLGGVFGIAICAAVFAAYGSYASPATFISGFGPAMGACAGLALAGAVAGLLIPARPPLPARRRPLAGPPQPGASLALEEIAGPRPGRR